MKVVGVSWTRFRLPLKAPFRTAAGEFTYREGLLLRLTTDAGTIGLGEASPHPALGPAAAKEAQEALKLIMPRLLNASIEEIADLIDERLPPALACAIDTAACDALAIARGVSIARLLSGSVAARVPANATIGAETDHDTTAAAMAARESGFRCVKLKVGMGRGIEEERQRVAAVRQALGPDIGLRLDANGAWDVERAVQNIRWLAEYKLELVEQPVASDNIEGMARVRAAVDVPIAADEAVAGVEAARWVLEARAADVLVIKPMVVGGLRPGRRIIEMAEAAGARAIVTTTIDGGVGAAAALHLAATLGPGNLACGLATSSLLADDFITCPLTVRDGWMGLPDGPGLGVELDEEKLARYGGLQREVA